MLIIYSHIVFTTTIRWEVLTYIPTLYSTPMHLILQIKAAQFYVIRDSLNLFPFAPNSTRFWFTDPFCMKTRGF